MTRIVITGGPKTGKTTMAGKLNVPVKHTDDLIASHDWSAASAAVAKWLAEPGPYVIEGVAAARGLRKALAASPYKPCDAVIFLSHPMAPRNPGQEAMAKGVRTVFDEILPELRRRGVDVRDEG